MRKPIISLALLTLTLGVSAGLGCSAPDPGVGYLGPRHPAGAVGNSATTGDDGGGTVISTPTPPSGGGDDGGGITPLPGTDGGTTSPADGGATGEGGGGEGGAVPTFLGEATPYASKPVATSARTSHANNGQAAQQPNTDCLGCHQTGGAGVPFLAAGFVATAANGTTGATGVEVRVYAQGANAGFSGYTDVDGFFWINPPVGGAAGPYQGGARDGTTTCLMAATQTAADCQSGNCHGGGQGAIHVP